MNNHIWVVTYWNREIEPVVTVFDNKDAAQACYDYFSKEYLCCVDECNIYSSFTQNPSKRIEYGTDGNLYEMSISNGTEYEETIPPERMTPSENRAYWGIYS